MLLNGQLYRMEPTRGIPGNCVRRHQLRQAHRELCRGLGKQMRGSGFPYERSPGLGSARGLISRHDAVEHEIPKGPQDSHVFCLSFMVPVLSVAKFGFG